MTQITLRKVTAADFEQVLSAERKAMPAKQYLPEVFKLFLGHTRGEFSVAEIEDTVVACAKFTVLPDQSAWLETIRVSPEWQGLGVGKRFYENYAEIAQREGVNAMRMYTGIHNAVSKGLAERFGLTLAETFDGTTLGTPSEVISAETTFSSITDPEVATKLIMKNLAEWGDYVVMNRTFYKLTPALCAHFAQQNAVFAGADGVVVIGARFMPEEALHVGFFAGDANACLTFASQQAQQRGVPIINCLYPSTKQQTKAALLTHGYELGDSQFIVMENILE